jgi:hypothetical protein
MCLHYFFLLTFGVLINHTIPAVCRLDQVLRISCVETFSENNILCFWHLYGQLCKKLKFLSLREEICMCLVLYVFQ